VTVPPPRGGFSGKIAAARCDVVNRVGFYRLGRGRRDRVLKPLHPENLARFPQVRAGLDAGTLRVHAWFYDVGRAELYEWSPEQRAFAVLGGAEAGGT